MSHFKPPLGKCPGTGGCRSYSRRVFQPEFGAYRGLARVLKSPSNPQNCRKKEKIIQKDTLFSAPNPGMHQTLVQKRSDTVSPVALSDPTKMPPLPRDKCSNTPVALCFPWYRRQSLLHPHFLPPRNRIRPVPEPRGSCNNTILRRVLRKVL